jgi:hypothetical protein
VAVAGDTVAGLIALAHRELASDAEKFAEAAAAGDHERADTAVGEAAELAAALKRQERMRE